MDSTILSALIGLGGTILAALLGYYYGRRSFLHDERFKDKQKKRNALASFLGTTAVEIQTLLGDYYAGPVIPSAILPGIRGMKEFRKCQHLNAEIEKVAALFVNDGSAYESFRILSEIVLLASLERNDKDALDNRLEQYAKAVGGLHITLKKLDSDISGLRKEARWRFWKRNRSG